MRNADDCMSDCRGIADGISDCLDLDPPFLIFECAEAIDAVNDVTASRHS